ncbi:MAG: hypothetical protein JXC32_03245, partial [Anaerolineae bacterium]|nr:hypothetical protein [Anaerolineae bacterium]
MKRNQATTVSQTATGPERTSPLGTLGRGHWRNFGVFLLSVGTLLFEITLTRLFSVAQFYHFAFMIVSLAMLGFGASGTWLALAERGGFRVLSRRRRPDPDTTPPAPAPSPPAVEDSPSSASPPTSPGAALDIPLAPFALAFGIACLFAYGVFNWLPFDSFSIAWDMRQVLLLCLHYVVLAVPFFCSGAVLSLRFAQSPADGGQGSRVGTIYAYNLAGSAVGCVLALLLPGVMGGVGPVWISAALGGLAAL